MIGLRDLLKHIAVLSLFLGCFLVLHPGIDVSTLAQDSSRNLTPRQREIEKQKQRIGSAEVEERRDAVARLGLMRHPEASRTALAGLSDESPMVRATAARAVLALPSTEVASALIPLLSDREEFVRREAACALGVARIKAAVPGITGLLATDKDDGVRAAAAVALGEIADESSVVPLVQVISGQAITTSGESKRKSKPERNEFVVRASVVSLGKIRNRAAVPALIAVLGNEKLHGDVRRSAATSLGLIGDPSAISPLQTALSSPDPYVARAASEALLKIKRANQSRG
jgi:HEAT repeat protein